MSRKLLRVNIVLTPCNQFKRNKVWELFPRPNSTIIIGTKWTYKNKYDENGNVTRNKARLMAQWYTQIRGVNFYETFAHVTRLDL